MPQYIAYSLRIQSEFEIPEFHQASFPDGNLDVAIASNTVGSIGTPAERGVTWKASANLLELRVPSVANFLVVDGRNIHIELFDPTKEREMRVYLLGSVIAALLYQRGDLVMHACSIATPNGATLFCGKSGAGKSTLAATLALNGYPMIADDVTVIRNSDGCGFYAPPSFPISRLCGDVVSLLNWTKAKYAPLELEERKFQTSSPRFASKAQLPTRIAFLIPDAVERISIRPFSPLESISNLVKRSYRYRFAVGMGLKEAHFKNITELAQSVQCFEIRRPIGLQNLDSSLRALMDFVRDE
ncbi:hypothetical protein [Pelagicoccus sp. SDUM812003]|uniref:hypothetical protein n=1 Tax=Pelagicoccus sp. SDUM812003 TaxID=3041267 RepID=UPI00280F3774|nr:hypothetical protein [Pelagicoccus sp. SDUM812003]MDQ8205643.1 hypothetical protein [Pelagicoccus sp. SDUM812003]